MIPTLTTARLILRAPVMADFPDYAAFLASGRSVYMDGPLDQRGAWAYFTNDVAQWTLLGMGGLMIELKAGGPAIGQVAVCHGPIFPETELGWFLYDGHEGNGYVTEAATVMRDWAWSHLGFTTMVSYIDPPNIASANVAKRLGAVLDPHAATPGNNPDLVYRHTPGGRS